MTLIDRFTENVNYRTLLKIQDICQRDTNSVMISSYLITLLGLSNNNFALSALGGATTLASFGLRKLSDKTIENGGYLKTKDVSSAIKLYDQFIVDYISLNEEYGFKDGIAMAVAFNYWLKNGYLSKERNSSSLDEKHIEISELVGANVLTGSDYAKHNFALLTDILNKKGFEAHDVSLFKPIEIDQLLLALFDIKKILDITDEEFLELTDHFLQKDGMASRITRKKDNNVILVVQGGKNFFIDLLTNRICEQDTEEKDFIELDPNYKGNMIPFKARMFSNTIEEATIRNRPNNDEVSIEEAQKLVDVTIKTCEKKPLEMNRFYHDHVELYDKMENLQSSITGQRRLIKSPQKQNFTPI